MGARFAAIGSLLSLALAMPVAAQEYPVKPIRMMVPNTAGGVTDIAARLIGPRMAEILGQPMVIENRIAAGGVVAANNVAQAAPDGYTLITVFDSFATNPFLFQGVAYDAVKSFAPISLVIKGPQVLAVNPGVGVKSFKEFIELARKQGTAMSFATAGAGTSSRLSLELLKITTGINPTAVHYKGGAPAITDLIGGQVAAMVVALNIGMPYVKAGKLMALAVTSNRRVATLPGVPAVNESFPGFEAQSWVGVLAPAGTPRPIIDKLNATVHRVLAMPEVRERFESQGSVVTPSTPEEFRDWLRIETDKWGRIIRDLKITLDS